MEAIRTVDLTKCYKNVVAVDKLNLSVDQGEIFALLGVNGAGKTTTVKMLTTLTRPSEGDAYIMGKSVTKEPYEVKKYIDVSMQETAIAKNLSVSENLSFYADICSIKKDEAQARISEIVESFDFSSVLNKRAKTLSGGWQRKLSIATALISRPAVLFLDEPTLGLDVLARRELWQMIEKLRGKTTIVLTTHYMEEAQALSDRIGIMKGGRLIAVDTADGFIKKTGADNFEDAFVSVIEKGGV